MKFDLQKLLGGIPFTTLCIVGVIIAFRPEIWTEMVEEYSFYLGVSKTTFIILGAVGVLGVMALCSLAYVLIRKYLDYRAAEEEARRVTDYERQALVTIFNALNGKRWKDKTRWCSDEPISRWKGVHLNPRTKRVNKLILPENELEGELPEDIGNLTELIEIDLRMNRIRGPIPDSFLNLSKLQGIYLYDNFMEGEIPIELSDLPSLSGIYLFNNNFTNAEECATLFREKLPEECYVFI